MHRPNTTLRERLLATKAFTLIEVLFAVALIGIATSTTLWAQLMMNTEASVARNITGATTCAQNQIDIILSDGPFNPQKTNIQDGSQQIPPDLQLGTRIRNNVPVYKDPLSGIVVPGKMTTTITDISYLYGTFQIYTYLATVKVEYTYRNRNYLVQMSTIRTSDI